MKSLFHQIRTRLKKRKQRRPHIYVLSFPKSGRTWLTYFLATYMSRLYHVPFRFELFQERNSPDNIPAIKFVHWNPMDVALEGLEDFILQKYVVRADCRFVYLYRDPRDVVVSYYFQIMKRIGSGNRKYAVMQQIQDMTLAQFIRTPEFGLPRIIAHMNAVRRACGDREGVLYLSYEQCQEHRQATFAELLTFVHEEKIDSKIFEEAIDASSFETMRQVEQSNTIRSNKLQARDLNDPDSFKVRKGTIGGYKDYFTHEDLVYAEACLTELDSFFGYSRGGSLQNTRSVLSS